MNRISIVSLVVFVFLWPLHQASAQQSGEIPMISFSQLHPLLQGEGAQPIVRVYESGVVVVDRPVGMKRPGSYRISVSQDQISTIKSLMQKSANANSQALVIRSRGKVSRDASGSTTKVETDPTTSVMRINKSVLQPSVSGAQAAPSINTLAVAGLAEMADESDAESIDSMRELELVLLAFFDKAGR